MLEKMRKGSQNIFVKTFLILLALSFVVWGIGDIFRGRTNNVVAKVGDIEISNVQFSNAVQREVARYQQAFGGALTEEQMQQLGFKQVILERLINSNLISIRSNQLGLKVGTESVKNIVKSEPAFFDENGNFTESSFNKVLRANGINPNDYINSIKSQVSVDMLIQNLILPFERNELQAKVIFNYTNEERIADIFYIDAKLEEEISEPSETDLVQYYQDNQVKFTAPEIRNVSYIEFGIENLKSTIDVSEEEINNIYQTRIEEFKIPAKRNIDQYLADSKENAQIIYEKLKSNKKIDDNELINMGDVSQSELIDGLGEFVFTSDLGVLEPVESTLGWHVFIVNKKIEEATTPLELVKADIKKDAIETQAASEFEGFVVQIEDSFASGKSLDEVAATFNLKLRSIEDLQKNSDLKSDEEFTISDKGAFLSQTFTQDSGTTSPLIFLDDGSYFVVKVNSVTESRIKALDEVKGIAINAYKEDVRQKKVLANANKTLEELKKAEEYNEIAQTNNIEIKSNQLVKRPSESTNETDHSLPFSLTSELFDLNINEFTTVYLEKDDKFVVAKLKEVSKPNIDNNLSEFSALSDKLKQTHADSILFQYNDYLKTKIDVDINQEAIASY